MPAALAEPTVPVRRNWITLLFLANIGLWLGIYAPIQVLLPEQVQSLHDHITKSNVVPSGTDAVLLSVVMGVGAIAGLIANPVVGALSDRTTSPRAAVTRGPWAARSSPRLGLLVVAAAPAIPVMAVGWFIAELGLGGMLATLTAALPDRVPVGQRGTIGALIGISQMLGTVLGALLVTVIITRMSAGYVACAVIVVGFAAAFTLRTTDEPLPAEYKPDHPVSTALRGLWVSPRTYPDFAWGWATHFLDQPRQRPRHPVPAVLPLQERALPRPADRAADPHGAVRGRAARRRLGPRYAVGPVRAAVSLSSSARPR